MRFLLAVALVLLFLWLQKSHVSDDGWHRNPCEVVSVSEAAASVLLSPLSLYSWLTSTLVRLIFSAPALVLASLRHSLMLLLACPWCVATVCTSFLLTCLHVSVYLIHLALVVGAVAILALARHKMADAHDKMDEKTQWKQGKVERRHANTRGRILL